MQLCTEQTPYAAVHCVQLVVDLLEQHKRALMLFCPLDAFFHKLDPEKNTNFVHFKDTTRRRLNGAVNSSRRCVKFNHKLIHVQNLEHLNTKKVQSAIRGVNGRTLS